MTGIILVAIIFLAIGYLLASLKASVDTKHKLDVEREKEIETQHQTDLKIIALEDEAKKAAQQKANSAVLMQRNVLKGKISEQVAPFLADFPKDLKVSEAHFLGNPVDLIVFKD